MRLYIIIFFSFIYINGCSLQKRISKEIAIKLAEKYVIDNGYAFKRINLDSTITKFDLEEAGLSKEQIEESRYTSLLPKAIYVKKINFDGWLVVFRYSFKANPNMISESKKLIGAAFIVSRNGKKIYMEHQDYIVNINELLK